MASSSSTMDPKKWGKLQQYVDLENVYLKLPLCRFFQLRGVCKAWNTLAQQRRSFTERVQKPYFVIVYPASFGIAGVLYHAGLLTLQIASGQWRCNRLPVNHLPHLNGSDFDPFSVNGLVFHSSWQELKIYDIHTRRNYDELCEGSMSSGPCVVAMAVDTSAMPYAFQIIIGKFHFYTSIFNDSDWIWHRTRARPSRIPAITDCQTWPPTCMKSCVQRDDCVYTWCETNTIQVYSLKEDKWTTLNPPENDGVGGALGCWNDRLFVVMEDGKMSVSVWELVDESRQAWRPFARIPGEMSSWLVASAEEDHILASFCDRYVLMYTLLEIRRDNDKEGMRDHFVLFDVATKQWEKASLKENTQSNSDGTRRIREHVGTSRRRRSLNQKG